MKTVDSVDSVDDRFSDFGSTNLTKSRIPRVKKTVWTAWTVSSPLSLYPKKNGNVIGGLSSKGNALSTLSSLSGPKTSKNLLTATNEKERMAAR
jgi:hypothetical protein